MITTLNTPIGNIDIITKEDVLVSLRLNSSKKASSPNTPFLKEISGQIKAYFSDASYQFDLPLTLTGTDFQLRVWRALRRIPIGKTLSYGALAKKLDTSPRAIGNACRLNPIPLIIPCHRILAKNGLGGFSGDTSGKLIKIKKMLLAHEKNTSF